MGARRVAGIIAKYSDAVNGGPACPIDRYAPGTTAGRGGAARGRLPSIASPAIAVELLPCRISDYDPAQRTLIRGPAGKRPVARVASTPQVRLSPEFWAGFVLSGDSR